MSPSEPSSSRVRFTSASLILHAFATVGRAFGNGYFQTLKSMLDVLLDVVTGAIRRNSLFRFPADQFVDGHPQCFSHKVPQGNVYAANGVHGDAGPAV